MCVKCDPGSYSDTINSEKCIDCPLVSTYTRKMKIRILNEPPTYFDFVVYNVYMLHCTLYSVLCTLLTV